ncbi:Neuraminidase (Sialidase) [Corynebacterium pseudotuberculosis]|uniref:exo-alpha-sialidase n=1 Tax=Corynebacterium pseudotuberculosis 258 TaxID=1168865 RepID=A0AAU8RZB6_CORPS|nr:sialidase family protein [Corynebacterium pseudotuberculosis]AJF93848.1 exo-alpha-sialidase [Corynebacterium pseudotuberculosis 258]APQ53533.1 Neuraminidase (Sialidase) [Corynebacterium pseudotuberculosis]APQ55593.1 Neuraminidase (Sialidase) [Corynebacterium pseudotuberculosis]ART29233.1 exo-alpha-sialidase [Corynebacterium pseudotuberculosis CIP 52.97]ASC74753.1 exo-alpha-sialidase [Corynebacterium pseudotuberculosis]
MTDSHRRGTRKALVTLTAALALTTQGLTAPATLAEEGSTIVPAPIDNNGLFDAAPPAPVARGAVGEGKLPEPVTSEFFDSKVIRDVDPAGQRCFRIPAIATAVDGTLLVAFDNRYGPDAQSKTWCRDAPYNNKGVNTQEMQTDIEIYRSYDSGESFEKGDFIAKGTEDPRNLSYTDPAIVVDHETGKIFAFFVRGYDYRLFDANKGINPGPVDAEIARRDVQDTVVIESDDDGKSWKNMRMISDLTETLRVKTRPGQEVAGYGRFVTSGSGIQLAYGPKAGRLLVPIAVNTKDSGQNRVVNLAIYSDDHGLSWEIGEGIAGDGVFGGDENKLVELSDGRIMMNSKDNDKDRWTSYSFDQGEHWSDPVRTVIAPPQHPEMRNKGINVSLIRAYPNAPEGSAAARVLLYSAPIDLRQNGQDGRSNGWVMASCDDGRSWTHGRQIEAGRFQYSVMTPMADGNIGMVYESGDKERGMTLKFAKFNMAWLGADCLSNKALGITDLPDPALAKAIEDAKAATAKAEEATANVLKLTKELEEAELENEELAQALAEAKSAAQDAIAAAEEANARVKAAEGATTEAEEAAMKAENEAKALAEQLAKVEAELANSQDQAKALAEAKEAAEIARKAAEEALKLEKEKSGKAGGTDNTENKGFWQELLRIFPGFAPIFSFLASIWGGMQKLLAF